MKVTAGIGSYSKEPKISDGTVHAWIVLGKEKDGTLFFPPASDIVGKSIEKGKTFSTPFDQSEIEITPYDKSKSIQGIWYGVKGRVIPAKTQCKWAVEEGLFLRKWFYRHFYIILDCIIPAGKRYYIDEVGEGYGKDMLVEEAVVEKVYDNINWVSYLKLDFSQE